MSDERSKRMIEISDRLNDLGYFCPDAREVAAVLLIGRPDGTEGA